MAFLSHCAKTIGNCAKKLTRTTLRHNRTVEQQHNAPKFTKGTWHDQASENKGTAKVAMNKTSSSKQLGCANEPQQKTIEQMSKIHNNAPSKKIAAAKESEYVKTHGQRSSLFLSTALEPQAQR